MIHRPTFLIFFDRLFFDKTRRVLKKIVLSGAVKSPLLYVAHCQIANKFDLKRPMIFYLIGESFVIGRPLTFRAFPLEARLRLTKMGKWVNSVNCFRAPIKFMNAIWLSKAGDI